jgi:hypothetical protein
MGNVRIRVIRPLLLDGVRVPAGELLDVAPRTGLALLEGGRAELVNAKDRAAIAEVQRAAVRDAVRRIGPPALPPEHGPWFPTRLQ